MATWTTIPDASLEPGKPIRSIDGIALRDNPVAIAEGASGAPKIQAASLATGDPERDWVLARIASASVGAVGTLAFLTYNVVNTDITAGTIYDGSLLSYYGLSVSASTGAVASAVTVSPLTGTWMALGSVDNVGSLGDPWYSATLFVRIS